jgi:uncharacterized membrane protein YuzA (DUF378 family)
MRRLGIWLVIIGALNWLVPRVLHMDLIFFRILGAARDYVAGAVIVAGAVLIIMGSRKKPPQGTV